MAWWRRLLPRREVERYIPRGGTARIEDGDGEVAYVSFVDEEHLRHLVASRCFDTGRPQYATVLDEPVEAAKETT
jgi:hypothetical protein